MAAAIVRDHAISMGQKEKHLVVPVVGAERPTVMKHDRLRALRTPVFVEDRGAVFSRDRWHEKFSLIFLKTKRVQWRRGVGCGSSGVGCARRSDRQKSGPSNHNLASRRLRHDGL